MRILIIKTSSYGDIVHIFPVVAALRQSYPEAIIDWIVEERCASLVQAHPNIDNAICIDTRKWRRYPFSSFKDIAGAVRSLRKNYYDVVIDLQGNMKSGLFTGLARSRRKIGFGFNTTSELLNGLFTNQHVNPPKGQNVREEYLAVVKNLCHLSEQSVVGHQEPKTILRLTESESVYVRKLLASRTGRAERVVLVAPGSAWKNKQLEVDVLVQFLEYLYRQYQVSFWISWGTEQERVVGEKIQKHMPEQVQLLDKASLPVLQQVMSHMDLVIAVDSLPLHLAGTAGVPTFSVFGASSANKYAPRGQQHRTLQGECPYGQQFERRCPLLRTCSTGACIRGLSVESLIHAFNQFNLF